MDRAELRRLQLQWVRHLRDPQRYPAPEGVDPGRLAIHHDLIVGNQLRLLSGAFPVASSILGETDWTACVHAFLTIHRSRTPLFARIAEEFVAFIQAHAHKHPSWLAELVHYEQVELAVQSDDTPIPAHNRSGDLLEQPLVLNPWLAALAYRWPVHRFVPGQALPVHTSDPTLLLVWRRRTHQVRFAQISAPVFRLVELIELHPGHTGSDLIAQLAEETAPAARDAFVASGSRALTDLHRDDIVLGTHPSAASLSGQVRCDGTADMARHD